MTAQNITTLPALRALYGPAHRFELDSRPGLGLTVRIVVPLRYTEDDKVEE